ncbi:PilZ domain-containing protein [Paraglaciecola hydrolytica]|uniref:Pilus assembly protein PilZ n=1 Tax=Paraglaciecola hydrolytica TaxID=1799789 RepID=A0A136A681_9ALTE|nr:PilZ domain-containing protein [Paraglaciecola hydrolytica]KXI30733.1 pilus assembly protein PilZ [Paraglaciecola hydrolytica]
MAIVQDTVGLTNEDFRKIRLMRPGTAIDLQVSSANMIKRVRTEFVGMDGTRCMIIRFPDESKWGSLRDSIFTDQNLVIRYILEDETGEIIAFKVKITLILTKPSHLIFTSFPLSIQSHDLRAEPRAQTRAAVTLIDADKKKDICQCLVRDISLKGCRISIDKSSESRPLLKQNVIMKFKDAAGNNLLLKGSVMNSKFDEVTVYFGIKFQNTEEEVGLLLQKMMLVTS